jgi:hypothetical protein
MKMIQLFGLAVILLCNTVQADWIDNFDGNEPNQAVWTFVNPLGDGSLTMADGAVLINVPPRRNHDVWVPNEALRLTADFQNVDFTIETRFTSAVSTEYQMQGLIVEQDSDDFIRFDVSSSGSSVGLYAAHFVNGTANRVLNTTISKATSYYLRINRQANQWTLNYSYDGTQWLNAAGFTRAMAVSSAGIYAGNFESTNSSAPRFTAAADYFRSSVAPLRRGTNQFGMIVNAAGYGVVTKNPDEKNYNAGDQVTLTAVPNAGSVFNGWNGAVGGSNNPVVLTVTGNHVVTAAFGPANGDVQVQIWYGQHQVFGRLGTPQRRIDILGNVTNPDYVESLKYSLNGGPLLPLSIGTANQRLSNLGDFDVEIFCTDLLPAPAQNNIQIIATDMNGKTAAASVICEYQKSTVWPLPYDINWSSVTDISDVAQIVDGRWVLDANGVTVAAQGYDRSIAIGDANTWRDYEVTVPITVHTSYHILDQIGGEPEVGFVMRWTGHYPKTSEQPVVGVSPIGSSVLFFWSGPYSGNWCIYDHHYQIVSQSSAPGVLQPGITYIFKMRVETIPNVGGLYRFKVWQSGQTEPSAWLLQQQESMADPQYGSVLLLAHHVDATFGNIIITGLGYDLNGNGSVDFADFNVLCSHWLDTGQNIFGDFNHDGKVDFADFAKFTGNW